MCLPMEHQEVHKNLFRNSHAFQDLEMLVLEERGKPEYPEKNHLEPGQGIEPGTNWWKANAPTTAPSSQNRSQKCLCLQANLLEQTTENRKLLIHTAGKCCTIM